MDLSSIESKCQSGKYEDAQQFVDDVALMLDNAELYNQVQYSVHWFSVASDDWLCYTSKGV